MIYRQITNKISDWLAEPGNSIEYKYYTGTEPSSGGGTDIAQILYYQGDFLRFVINLVYDSNGRIIKQYTTKQAKPLDQI